MQKLQIVLIIVLMMIFGSQLVKADVNVSANATDICSLPAETGPCDACIERWAYNSESGKCNKFTYGGCKGNANNFKTEQECQNACACDYTNICSLPAETGPCTAIFQRWAYNSKLGKCYKFTYGGCKGNANNFETQEECQNACDICLLPAKPGPCYANIPRWAYNSKSRQCEKFIYGGCKGNANNFKTKMECQNACTNKNICSLPVKPGPCYANIPRWAYNSKSGECEKFIYGGCQGNANNFKTKEECQNACDICSLPAETGPCTAIFQRWAYNSKLGTCEKFSYGGCPGNANNFETKKECENACANKNICSLPAEPGPCYGYILRWTYNSESGNCEKFIYGGCKGNANNFETKKNCQNACDICTLPAERGPCRGYIPRWAYNSQSGKCYQFIYGGCQGNANNFQTKEECQNACGMDICSLPAETGPCKAYIRRWSYNQESEMCEQFTYGGCQGNANNFETEEECNNSCACGKKK